jgi:hypothetical protein
VSGWALRTGRQINLRTARQHQTPTRAFESDPPLLSTALVAVFAVVVGWHSAARDEPRHATGTTAAAYPIGAAYSLPWYALWGLPALTDAEPTPLAWVVWLQAAAMLTVLKFHDHPAGTAADAIPRFVLTVMLPLAWVVAFVVTGLRQHQRTPQPHTSPRVA